MTSIIEVSGPIQPKNICGEVWAIGSEFMMQLTKEHLDHFSEIRIKIACPTFRASP
ncbi:MAG: hypothetical protein IPN33_25670 [Saprospiraceae bacterium]|nr:hypothetical protein [Saprospiraceae bacterium]